MQEDKKLQELLQQFATETVSVDFTQNVMQHIEANMVAKQTTKPLVTPRLLQVLGGVFVIVLGLLLVLCFKDRFTALPTSTVITLPEKYTLQLTWFIIVFWVGMLINTVYQQTSKRAV